MKIYLVLLLFCSFCKGNQDSIKLYENLLTYSKETDDFGKFIEKFQLEDNFIKVSTSLSHICDNMEFFYDSNVFTPGSDLNKRCSSINWNEEDALIKIEKLSTLSDKKKGKLTAYFSELEYNTIFLEIEYAEKKGIVGILSLIFLFELENGRIKNYESTVIARN